MAAMPQWRINLSAGAIGLVLALGAYYFSEPTFTARESHQKGIMAPDRVEQPKMGQTQKRSMSARRRSSIEPVWRSMLEALNDKSEFQDMGHVKNDNNALTVDQGTALVGLFTEPTSPRSVLESGKTDVGEGTHAPEQHDLSKRAVANFQVPKEEPKQGVMPPRASTVSTYGDGLQAALADLDKRTVAKELQKLPKIVTDIKPRRNDPAPASERLPPLQPKEELSSGALWPELVQQTGKEDVAMHGEVMDSSPVLSSYKADSDGKTRPEDLRSLTDTRIIPPESINTSSRTMEHVDVEFSQRDLLLGSSSASLAEQEMNEGICSIKVPKVKGNPTGSCSGILVLGETYKFAGGMGWDPEASAHWKLKGEKSQFSKTHHATKEQIDEACGKYWVRFSPASPAKQCKASMPGPVVDDDWFSRTICLELDCLSGWCGDTGRGVSKGICGNAAYSGKRKRITGYACAKSEKKCKDLGVDATDNKEVEDEERQTPQTGEAEAAETKAEPEVEEPKSTHMGTMVRKDGVLGMQNPETGEWKPLSP